MIRFVVVGEHLADIAQRRRAENRVGYRVQQHIGVAVTDRLGIVGNRNAAQQKRPPRRQPVCVLSESNAHEMGSLVE